MPEVIDGMQELHNEETVNRTDIKPKSAKDFTPEEAERLLARVREIGLGKAAEEAGVTNAVVIALRRKAIIKSVLEEKARAASTPIPLQAGGEVAEQVHSLKRSRDFSIDEKAKIVARAKIVGAAQAAKEAGITTSMIYNWTFYFKTQDSQDKQETQQEVFGSERQHKSATPHQEQPKPKTIKEEVKPAVKEIHLETKKTPLPETHVVYEMQPKEHASALEIENIVLKEKVQYLTEQLERLKVAITALMGETTKTL